MAFLRNTAVNLLNLHYAVHALASGTGGVFFGVFLLRAGVSAPGVLVALTAILAGRFLLRPLILPLGIRFGLRPLVIAGALLMAAQYPLLAQVQGVDGMLYALCIVSAIGDVFYWTCYHAYFAALGDDEHRGHQISVREAAAAIIGIVAPLLGGWALTTLGPATAFGIVAVVQLFSALPLFGTPKVAIAPRADGALRAALGGIALFAADGWLSAGLVMIWQIALFNTLSDSFTAYGGAMALAALVGAISGLLLGRAIDAGAGPHAAILASAAVALTVLLRAFSFGHPALALLANALGAVAMLLYAPTFMTPLYRLAKQSSCTLRYHIATEGAYDVGAGASMLVAALILHLGSWQSGGAQLRDAMTLALLFPLAGVAVVYWLLRRYYAAAAQREP